MIESNYAGGWKENKATRPPGRQVGPLNTPRGATEGMERKRQRDTGRKNRQHAQHSIQSIYLHTPEISEHQDTETHKDPHSGTSYSDVKEMKENPGSWKGKALKVKILRGRKGG